MRNPTMATEVFATVVRFLKEYCGVHSLTSESEQAHLTNFIKELQRQTGGHGDVDVLAEAGPAAVLLWTSQKKFEGVGAQHRKELCSLINAAIRDDHEDLASSTAEITRAINTTCVVRGQDVSPQRFPTDGTSWRGSGFDDAHRPFFTVGKQYRVPGFLATSFSEAVATEFRDEWAFVPPGGSRIMWIVHVDPAGQRDTSKRCQHVNFVSHSHVGGESEYLFTAYSAFTVRSVRWGEGGAPHCIELDAAMDNKDEPEDLPLAPWY